MRQGGFLSFHSSVDIDHPPSHSPSLFHRKGGNRRKRSRLGFSGIGVFGWIGFGRRGQDGRSPSRPEPNAAKRWSGKPADVQLDVRALGPDYKVAVFEARGRNRSDMKPWPPGPRPSSSRRSPDRRSPGHRQPMTLLNGGRYVLIRRERGQCRPGVVGRPGVRRRRGPGWGVVSEPPTGEERVKAAESALGSGKADLTGTLRKENSTWRSSGRRIGSASAKGRKEPQHALRPGSRLWDHDRSE